LSKETAGWYDRWSVIPSHRFRFGATEWLMGVLYHYHKLLDQVGLLHAVVAALYSYPCHSGLLQALVELFNWRFNTFSIADEETCLDLWALHRVSGLPISGQFYEEVCLNDLHRDQSTGSGSYALPYSFRYLMKVWRDLARCGKAISQLGGQREISLHASWWRLESDPRQLPARTYLAAYLAYWLSTFVLPFGEEGNIRPEVIYPTCSLAGGVQLALAPATLANIFHGLGDLTASPSPRDRSIVLSAHYLSAWAGLLLPELCHNISLENPSIPLLFMFRNRPEQVHQRQLSEACRRLSFVPSAGQSGLDLACCSRDSRPYAEESRGGRIYHLPHSSAPSASFRKEWLCCIRPSVLLFRKGGSLFMEPYFPHRFARNFGYDQAVPPNADFALHDRTYRGLDRHLVASGWWCFFIRRDPSPEFFIPEQQRDGRVDVLYARWWTRHNQAFRERADVVKAAEGAYLSWAGASISSIASKFLRQEFPELVGKVSTVGRRRARPQAADPTDRKARAGALEPLARPEGSSATPRGGGEPPLVYFWWRHFLLDCGYQVDTALSALILPEVSRAWERHLCHSIARVGPREFISWIESGTTLQHFWDAVAEAGKAMKVSFDQVVLPPPFSQALNEFYSSGGNAKARHFTQSEATCEQGSRLLAAGRLGKNPRPFSFGAEDAPCGVMTAPLLSEPNEPLTAAGGNAPQPPFAAASPVGLASFSSHGVLWPSEPQSIQMADNGGVLETLMGLTRSAMEESSPPCLERVRGFLHRNTLAYHLMGYPGDPWMAAVDAVWDEVKQRCQEATRLKIQELSAEIALTEQRSEALRSQRGGAVSRVETLRAGCAQCRDDIIAIQQTIEEASKRLADRQAAHRALTEGATEAEAATTALEQEYADSQARLSVLQASLADLRRGPHTSL
ncbi:hypothetical protein Taro_024565, partial [Colocasia esculenta]|nr:hypothetical protein [Colocasia esculenta]